MTLRSNNALRRRGQRGRVLSKTVMTDNSPPGPARVAAASAYW